MPEKEKPEAGVTVNIPPWLKVAMQQGGPLVGFIALAYVIITMTVPMFHEGVTAELKGQREVFVKELGQQRQDFIDEIKSSRAAYQADLKMEREMCQKQYASSAKLLDLLAAKVSDLAAMIKRLSKQMEDAALNRSAAWNDRGEK